MVDEQVVVAALVGEALAGLPAELASGSFRSLAHGTMGTAAVVELRDGSRVLTLTGFETDPGPDLRVYLSPGSGGDVSGAVDLGGLKGNIGDQQYAIPAEVDAGAIGSVVIWCRAFSVGFGAAELTAA